MVATYLVRNHAELREHKDIKCVPVLEVASKVQDVYDAVETFSKSIEHLCIPISMKEHLTNLSEFRAVMRDHMAEAMQYHMHIEGFSKRTK